MNEIRLPRGRSSVYGIVLACLCGMAGCREVAGHKREAIDTNGDDASHDAGHGTQPPTGDGQVQPESDGSIDPADGYGAGQLNDGEAQDAVDCADAGFDESEDAGDRADAGSDASEDAVDRVDAGFQDGGDAGLEERADVGYDDVVDADSPNLIADGTFETGRGAWTGWGASNWGVTMISVVSTAAHSGAHSLLGAGMLPDGALVHNITALVSPGQRYFAKAWVMVNTSAGMQSVTLGTLQACDGAATATYLWLKKQVHTNGVWAEIDGVVDLRACTTVDNEALYIGADSGDLYIDDVSLTPAP